MSASEYILLIGLLCNISSLAIAGAAFLRAGQGTRRAEIETFERRMTTAEERLEIVRGQVAALPPAAPADLVHGIEDRLARIEGALSHRPTADQVSEVALSIARLEGGVEAVRAEMRGLHELMVRVEARGDRHEAMLTDAARGTR